MSENPFSHEIDASGIATLTFDLPGEKLNTLSPKTLDQFSALLGSLAENKEIHALILRSGKEHSYVAGLDLKEVQGFMQDLQRVRDLLSQGHEVFRQLEDLPFPTIAAIDGVCLGGGLELALACTYRVASDHPATLIGLPEVNLGLIPGWGGTFRLPRTMGLSAGMQAILGGKTFSGAEAFKKKIVDDLLAYQHFDAEVKRFAKQITNPKAAKQIVSRRQKRTWSEWFLGENFLGRRLLEKKARENILKKTKGHYPAPLVALDVMCKTYGMSYKNARMEDPKLVLNALPGAFKHAPNLVHLFFMQEEIKKESGVADPNVKPKPLKATGVIGAGTMGSGIAWVLHYRGYRTRMRDIDWKMVGNGYLNVEKIYKQLLKIRKIKPREIPQKLGLLTASTDLSGFQAMDLVIEAATEQEGLKRKIFNELEEAVRPGTILATNTSSLSVDSLAKGLKHPERFIGMHFFNPANRMPLVEVVPGEKTSPEAVATAVALCKKLKKTPVVVKDCAGFLVNRILVLSLIEALSLLEEGVPMEQIEKPVVDFGMPMSPFVLADTIGVDVCEKIMPIFKSAYGERIKVPELLSKMTAKELYGKKNGKGFYLYEGKKERHNPEIRELLGNPASKSASPQEVIDRVLLVMVNEASRCLEDGIVAKPSYLDIAMIFGTGFPPFRGGLLRYADTRGLPEIVEKLRVLAGKHGAQFQPTRLIEEMARDNKTFY